MSPSDPKCFEVAFEMILLFLSVQLTPTFPVPDCKKINSRAENTPLQTRNAGPAYKDPTTLFLLPLVSQCEVSWKHCNHLLQSLLTSYWRTSQPRPQTNSQVVFSFALSQSAEQATSANQEQALAAHLWHAHSFGLFKLREGWWTGTHRHCKSPIPEEVRATGGQRTGDLHPCAQLGHLWGGNGCCLQGPLWDILA